MIYAFGNSHVAIFSGTDIMVPIWPNRSVDALPWFRTFRIGAVTAYQALKHMTTIYEICGAVGFEREKDSILFVFGEVDIRAHIIEQSEKQNRPTVQIAKEVVDRYFAAIMDAVHNNIDVMVFGCIAGFKLQEGARTPPWPHSGSCVERNIITRIFNDRLEDKCEKESIPFISVFEEMLDENGETKICYLDKLGAGCHATTRLLPLILWKFRDKGLIPFEHKICKWEGGTYGG